MSSSDTTTPRSTFAAEQLEAFLAASRCDGAVERRAAERQPFFVPVTVIPSFSPERRWSAFSRDLSSDGIGLLHNLAIERGAVCELIVKTDRAELRHKAQCMWCSAAGEGWYLSGWRFVPAEV
jgi:hypothetical protein